MMERCSVLIYFCRQIADSLFWHRWVSQSHWHGKYQTVAVETFPGNSLLNKHENTHISSFVETWRILIMLIVFFDLLLGMNKMLSRSLSLALFFIPSLSHMFCLLVIPVTSFMWCFWISTKGLDASFDAEMDLNPWCIYVSLSRSRESVIFILTSGFVLILSNETKPVP